MSVILGKDNNQFSQYVPEYEVPIDSREIVVVSEDVARDAQDFTSSMQFVFQNGDPTRMIRSAVIRMPLHAAFRDQEARYIPDDLVHQIGLRNRPSKCFRDVRCLVNGVQYNRSPELDGIEEHTRKCWELGPYQLENTALPIARPRLYQTNLAKQDLTSNAHGDIVSAAHPIVPVDSYGIQASENRNFEERVKMFRGGYNKDTDEWEGEIVIPVNVGPFQPYASKKTGRVEVNKFIPFVEQLQLEYDFDTAARGASH